MDMYDECENEGNAAKKDKLELIGGTELENILDSHLNEIKQRE